jgi:hypothetical protein
MFVLSCVGRALSVGPSPIQQVGKKCLKVAHLKKLNPNGTEQRVYTVNDEKQEIVGSLAT